MNKLSLSLAVIALISNAKAAQLKSKSLAKQTETIEENPSSCRYCGGCSHSCECKVCCPCPDEFEDLEDKIDDLGEALDGVATTQDTQNGKLQNIID